MRDKFKCPEKAFYSDPGHRTGYWSPSMRPEGATCDSPGHRPEWGNGPGAFGSTTPSPIRAIQYTRPTKDHFVGVNKMIERRLTSEEKKALKKPDTLDK